MNNESVADIAEATKRLLRNDRNLKMINMEYGWFYNSAAVLEAFVSAMETCSIANLRLEIYLDFGKSTKGLCGHITQLFQCITQIEHCEYITRLVRCDCICEIFFYCDCSIDEFASTVEAISQNPAMKKLEIRIDHLEKEATAITITTKSLCSGRRSLQSLIHKHMGDEGCDAFIEAQEKLYTAITITTKSLCSGRSSLQSLILKHMGDEGCNAFIEALFTYFPLEVLHARDCSIGIDGAKFIRKLLQSGECTIEELDLSKNYRIGHEGCAVIAGLLENSSIRILGMSWCKIGKEGAESIASALRSGNCTIQELNLSENYIQNEGCVAIMEALRNSTLDMEALHKINLSGCGIRNEGLKSIAKVLQNNHLEVLSLSRNWHIGMEGFKALAIVLSQNSSLKELNLYFCNVHDEGCIELMNALSQNSSLKVMNLQSCGIHHEGGKAVANFLKSNTGSIRELYLKGNGMNNESLIEIAKALHINTHLTNLSLAFSSNLKDVWIAFDDSTRHNYILQELDIDVWQRFNEFGDYEKLIETNIDVNKELGPVKAEMVKTGLFPHGILPCLSATSCFVESLSKVVSLGHLSPVFDLVCEHPTFFLFVS